MAVSLASLLSILFTVQAGASGLMTKTQVGFEIRRDAADGSFSPTTRHAVPRVQRNHELPQNKSIAEGMTRATAEGDQPAARGQVLLVAGGSSGAVVPSLPASADGSETPGQPTPRSPAERRVALVIGNGAYKTLPALGNPANDARAIADRLRGLHFDVEEGIDLSKADMDRTVRRFGEAASGADIAMVFYAGHGVQVNGHNYLVPIDAEMPHREQDLHYDFVDVDRIMEEVATARKLRIVVLDACRDNPVAAEIGRSLGRALGIRGLAAPPDMDNTLVAYATAANATASDGRTDHSPFTRALLKYLPEPNLEIRMLFGRVRDSVRRETDNQQNPFVYESLGGDGFYLNPEKTDWSEAAAVLPRPTTAPDMGQNPVQSSAGAGHGEPAPEANEPAAMRPTAVATARVPIARTQDAHGRAADLSVAMTGRWRFPDGGSCAARYGSVTLDAGLIRFEWHRADGSLNTAVERIDSADAQTIVTTVLSDVGTARPETGQRVRYTISPDGWVAENLSTHDLSRHRRC